MRYEILGGRLFGFAIGRDKRLIPRVSKLADAIIAKKGDPQGFPIIEGAFAGNKGNPPKVLAELTPYHWLIDKPEVVGRPITEVLGDFLKEAAMEAKRAEARASEQERLAMERRAVVDEYIRTGRLPNED